jgi:uncharacterized protein YeaO (DUF488 family)
LEISVKFLIAHRCYNNIMVKLKRIYEEYSNDDGYRILVDRLWPRGISKERAHLDLWLRDIAPTTKLRKWFGHEPAKWAEFQRRYLDELKVNPVTKTLEDLAGEETIVTLLYGAKDTEHNEALVIKSFLNK